MSHISPLSIVAKWVVVAALMAGVVPVLLGQQTPASADQNSNATGHAAEQSISSTEPSPPSPSDRMYAGSLFGSQPIAVELWQPTPVGDTRTAPPVQAAGRTDQDADLLTVNGQQSSRYFLLSGLTAMGSYEQASAAMGGNAYMSTLTPYAGLMGRTRTGFWVLQYAPTLVPYTQFGSGFQAYHSLSFNVSGSLSRTVNWSFSMGGGYGSEAGLLAAPLPIHQVVSGVSITDPSAATILPFNDNMLNASETASIAWKLNTKQTVSLNLGHTYFGLSNNSATASLPSSHTNDAHVMLDFGQTLSSRTTLHAYATTDRVYGTGMSPCSFYGGGLGISVAATKTVSVSAGAGPETSSANCGGGMGANFYASVAAALPHRATAYVSAQRSVMTAFRTNSIWEDNVTAGISKSLRSVSMGFDGGYYRGQPLATGLPSSGYFVSPHIDYGLKVAKFTTLGAGYRRYHSSAPVAGAAGDIGYFFASLKFAPNAIPLQRK